jgi:predicted NBD/HSP70 family sugar kinase
MHAAKCPSYKLLHICIATPGIIDINTGYFLLAHRFEDYKDICLKKIFSENFGCGITVNNDIKLALEGERVYGKTLEKIKNAMMLHIGYSVGSALLLSDKAYAGPHGFAGELTGFSLSALTDGDDMFFPQEINNLDSVSVNSIVDTVRRAVENGREIAGYKVNPSDITFEYLIAAYNAGDAFVKNLISQASMIWARTLRNIVEFLDIEAIVIRGDIVKFGDGFKNTIEDYINKSLKFQDIKVVYSEFPDDGIVMGTVNAAVSGAIAGLLKK